MYNIVEEDKQKSSLKAEVITINKKKGKLSSGKSDVGIPL